MYSAPSDTLPTGQTTAEPPQEDTRAQPLANDIPQGPDLLGIESEVQALAEAIALKDMPPPLVVGILGGWGVGKSFVLHLIEEHLGRIRCESLTPGEGGGGDRESEEFPYVGHPYVIRFDAWTYAKSDLWASLMQSIFMELHRQIGLERRLAEEFEIDPLEGTEIWRLLHRMGDADLRRLSASPKVAEAVQALPRLERSVLEAEDLWHTFEQLKVEERAALAACSEELASARLVLEEEQKKLDAQVDKAVADEAKKEAFEPFQQELRSMVGLAVQETWAQQAPEVHELGQEVSAWRRLLKGWNSHSTAFALFAFLAFFGPVLVSLFTEAGQQIEGWIGELLAGGVLATLMAGMEALRGFRTWLEKRQQIYSQRLEAARQRHALAREQIREEKLQELQTMTAGTSELKMLEEEVRKLEAKVESHRRNVGLTAHHPSLLDFVQGRLQSGLYEQRLGLLHQAQRDLKELTEAFLPSPTESPDQQAVRRSLFPRGEPRVVLMIDDLDRCPPNRVVEVLEAAQLLVKTRLFVVILAMDVRYITRALEKVYHGVLERDGEPSGLDYIEKVVQIPYRVRPIRKEALDAFLRAQMNIEESSPSTHAPTRSAPEGQRSTTDEEIDFGAHYSLDGDLGVSSPSAPEAAGAISKGPLKAAGERGLGPSEGLIQESPWLRGNLPTRVQRFHLGELELLKDAIGAVEISPRAARRLVNVAKLLKIIWFRRGLKHGPPQAVKRAMFGLLATAAHYPEILRELLVDLERAFANGHGVEVLLTFLHQQCEVACASGPPNLCEAIRKALARALPDRLTLGDLGHDNFTLVNSFSFVGESEAAHLSSTGSASSIE